jgi:hypothetical protein
VRNATGFDSAGERLAAILETARGQRELLARTDLDGVQALQARRQQLMAGIQSLDECAQDARPALSEILRLDREMRWILLLELADIKEQIKTCASLRKLLRNRSPAAKRPPRHLSRHA